MVSNGLVLFSLACHGQTYEFLRLEYWFRDVSIIYFHNLVFMIIFLSFNLNCIFLIHFYRSCIALIISFFYVNLSYREQH